MESKHQKNKTVVIIVVQSASRMRYEQLLQRTDTFAIHVIFSNGSVSEHKM